MSRITEATKSPGEPGTSVVRCLSVIVIILFISSQLVFLSASTASATGWYDLDWKYRLPVTIDQSGDALTDYQVKLELDASDLDFSLVRSGGRDIRFTDSDGTTLIDHFIESYTGSSAVIWVRVPSLPASLRQKTIYLYYGNQGASSTSSADDVFMLYDDFQASGQPDNLDKVSRVGLAITPGYLGSWDALVRERMSVMYDEGVFKAWYSGHRFNDNPPEDELTSAIGYATSPDGLTWTKHTSNPVLDTEHQDQDPSVLKVDGTYYMYIEHTEQDPYGISIHLYRSEDGVTWEVDDPEIGNPVVPEGATPLVWQEAPDEWYMLYEHYPESGPPYDIYLATSSDGINWDLEDPEISNPVIAADYPTYVDVCPDGIYKDGDTYYLYYHGNGLPRNRYATSTDLVNWTLHGILYPRYYESFFPIEVNDEIWFYAWNTGAYLHLENGQDPHYMDGRINSGFHLLKGYDLSGSLDTTKWDLVQKGGSTSEINFNPDGIELSPEETFLPSPSTYGQSISLLSEREFTNEVTIEVRRELIGNSYADITLGFNGVVDEGGGTSDWWHTALNQGYTWLINHIDDRMGECIMLRRMDGGYEDLNEEWDDPGDDIQEGFEVHKLTYDSDDDTAYLKWFVDGELVSSAEVDDEIGSWSSAEKKILISQGQHDVNEPELSTFWGGQSVIDWIRVRKYSPSEPSCSFGAEQRRPVPPTGSVLIDGGAATTSDTLVTLNLSVDDDLDPASHNTMQISNSPDFDGAAWRAFNNRILWRLTEGYGTKTVYARFKDADGNISVTYSDSIEYPSTDSDDDTPPWETYQGPNPELHLAPVWYLPEGSTDWGYDTYLSLVNPNQDAVACRVTYMTESGPVVRTPDAIVSGMGQLTIDPREDLGSADFSTKVECLSNEPIAVDRTMIWTGSGQSNQDGHSSIGVTTAAREWYLPEGSSNWGFECWLLVQNPNSCDAHLNIEYMVDPNQLQPGETAPLVFADTIPPNSRRTYDMSGHIGYRDSSIKVDSDVPVIPERSMYRTAQELDPQNNRRGGHVSIGTTSPRTDYYLAEGSTAHGFECWLLVQNPNDEAATVDVTFMTEAEGAKPQAPFVMEPNSRRTLPVHEIVPGHEVSTHVHSDRPVIAERAMYWDDGSGQAAHDSIGVAEPHRAFYLPDGSATDGRETYVLVQNPNATPTTVEINYLGAYGIGNTSFQDTIAANSRKTYCMNDTLTGSRSSIVVTSITEGNDIMVERAMYWGGDTSRGGGTNTIGAFMDQSMSGVLGP